ncbi:MAG: hypothetical protein COA87_008105 [Halomonas sp.]|jgi:hypothetical protein|nr:hypothetical protein [Halomonas sp.]MBL1267698.1 hypothetical protein [Halomonas sp.]
MSFKSDTSGLDKLKENMERLSGQSEVKLANLFHPEFMSNCSSYTSFEALVEASDFTVESAEDFAAIPDDEWDAFISKSTSYASWEEMQKAAAADYARRQLFQGL